MHEIWNHWQLKQLHEVSGKASLVEIVAQKRVLSRRISAVIFAKSRGVGVHGSSGELGQDGGLRSRYD